MTNLTGFVNIVKPTGMTSSDVVLCVKKALKTKKVGHLGTLDPAASGVLPIAVGKATKYFDYFLQKDKVYVALVRFGTQTDTLDGFGNITKTINKSITSEDVNKIICSFEVVVEQIPPKYSAVKINGKKACDLARENIEFEIKPRQVNIYKLDLLENTKENEFLFKVHCSAGTYIRTLFNDIAEKLGTVATTTAIIRTKSGKFKIEEAITIDELKEIQRVQKVTELFADLKIVEVDDCSAKKLINGVSVSETDLNVDLNENEEFFVSYKNKTIGMYKKQAGKIITLVYLFED